MEGGLLGKVANSNTAAILLLMVIIVVTVALAHALAGAVGDKLPAPVVAILAPGQSREHQMSL